MVGYIRATAECRLGAYPSNITAAFDKFGQTKTHFRVPNQFYCLNWRWLWLLEYQQD